MNVSERRIAVTLTTRKDLLKIKSKALRTNVWFRDLSRVERAIMDLTIKCVDTIRSAMLAGTILKIVNKILQYLGKDFMARAERAGYEITERLCAFGDRWGNKTCTAWKFDKRFVRFQGVNLLNA